MSIGKNRRTEKNQSPSTTITESPFVSFNFFYDFRQRFLLAVTSFDSLSKPSHFLSQIGILEISEACQVGPRSPLVLRVSYIVMNTIRANEHHIVCSYLSTYLPRYLGIYNLKRLHFMVEKQIESHSRSALIGQAGRSLYSANIQSVDSFHSRIAFMPPEGHRLTKLAESLCSSYKD
jgi:hypothetical protein